MANPGIKLPRISTLTKPNQRCPLNSRFRRRTSLSKPGMKKNADFLQFKKNGELCDEFHRTNPRAVRDWIADFMNVKIINIGDNEYRVNRLTTKFLMINYLAEFTNMTNKCILSQSILDPVIRSLEPYTHDPNKPIVQFPAQLIKSYQQEMIKKINIKIQKAKNNKNKLDDHSNKLNNSMDIIVSNNWKQMVPAFKQLDNININNNNNNKSSRSKPLSSGNNNSNNHNNYNKINLDNNQTNEADKNYQQQPDDDLNSGDKLENENEEKNGKNNEEGDDDNFIKKLSFIINQIDYPLRNRNIESLDVSKYYDGNKIKRMVESGSQAQEFAINPIHNIEITDNNIGRDYNREIDLYCIHSKEGKNCGGFKFEDNSLGNLYANHNCVALSDKFNNVYVKCKWNWCRSRPKDCLCYKYGMGCIYYIPPSIQNETARDVVMALAVSIYLKILPGPIHVKHLLHCFNNNFIEFKKSMVPNDKIKIKIKAAIQKLKQYKYSKCENLKFYMDALKNQNMITNYFEKNNKNNNLNQKMNDDTRNVQQLQLRKIINIKNNNKKKQVGKVANNELNVIRNNKQINKNKLNVDSNNNVYAIPINNNNLNRNLNKFNDQQSIIHNQVNNNKFAPNMVNEYNMIDNNNNNNNFGSNMMNEYSMINNINNNNMKEQIQWNFNVNNNKNQMVNNDNSYNMGYEQNNRNNQNYENNNKFYRNSNNNNNRSNNIDNNNNNDLFRCNNSDTMSNSINNEYKQNVAEKQSNIKKQIIYQTSPNTKKTLKFLTESVKKLSEENIKNNKNEEKKQNDKEEQDDITEIEENEYKKDQIEDIEKKRMELLNKQIFDEQKRYNDRLNELKQEREKLLKNKQNFEAKNNEENIKLNDNNNNNNISSIPNVLTPVAVFKDLLKDKEIQSILRNTGNGDIVQNLNNNHQQLQQVHDQQIQQQQLQKSQNIQQIQQQQQQQQQEQQQQMHYHINNKIQSQQNEQQQIQYYQSNQPQQQFNNNMPNNQQLQLQQAQSQQIYGQQNIGQHHQQQNQNNMDQQMINQQNKQSNNDVNINDNKTSEIIKHGNNNNPSFGHNNNGNNAEINVLNNNKNIDNNKNYNILHQKQQMIQNKNNQNQNENLNLNNNTNLNLLQNVGDLNNVQYLNQDQLKLLQTILNNEKIRNLKDNNNNNNNNNNLNYNQRQIQLNQNQSNSPSPQEMINLNNNNNNNMIQQQQLLTLQEINNKQQQQLNEYKQQINLQQLQQRRINVQNMGNLNTNNTPIINPTLPPTFQSHIYPRMNHQRHQQIQPEHGNQQQQQIDNTPTINPTLPPTINPTLPPTFQPHGYPQIHPHRHQQIQPEHGNQQQQQINNTPTINPTVPSTFQPHGYPQIHPQRHQQIQNEHKNQQQQQTVIQQQIANQRQAYNNQQQRNQHQGNIDHGGNILNNNNNNSNINNNNFAERGRGRIRGGNNRNRGGYRNNNDLSNVRCYNCSKYGHYARNCTVGKGQGIGFQEDKKNWSTWYNHTTRLILNNNNKFRAIYIILLLAYIISIIYYQYNKQAVILKSNQDLKEKLEINANQFFINNKQKKMMGINEFYNKRELLLIRNSLNHENRYHTVYEDHVNGFENKLIPRNLRLGLFNNAEREFSKRMIVPRSSYLFDDLENNEEVIENIDIDENTEKIEIKVFSLNVQSIKNEEKREIKSKLIQNAINEIEEDQGDVVIAHFTETLLREIKLFNEFLTGFKPLVIIPSFIKNTGEAAGSAVLIKLEYFHQFQVIDTTDCLIIIYNNVVDHYFILGYIFNPEPLYIKKIDYTFKYMVNFLNQHRNTSMFGDYNVVFRKNSIENNLNAELLQAIIDEFDMEYLNTEWIATYHNRKYCDENGYKYGRNAPDVGLVPRDLINLNCVKFLVILKYLKSDHYATLGVLEFYVLLKSSKLSKLQYFEAKYNLKNNKKSDDIANIIDCNVEKYKLLDDVNNNFEIDNNINKYYETIDWFLKDVSIRNECLRLNKIKKKKNGNMQQINELQFELQQIIINEEMDIYEKQWKYKLTVNQIEILMDDQKHKKLMMDVDKINKSTKRKDHQFWKMLKNRKKEKGGIEYEGQIHYDHKTKSYKIFTEITNKYAYNPIISDENLEFYEKEMEHIENVHKLMNKRKLIKKWKYEEVKNYWILFNKKLSGSKSNGLYFLTLDVVKKININIFIEPALRVLNEGILPDLERIAKMVTIPKKGNKYRCIRAVGPFVSFLEFIINSEERKNVNIVPIQHGHEGTIKQILSLRILIEINTINNKPTGFCAADMDSAYDMVLPVVNRYQYHHYQPNVPKRVYKIKKNIENNKSMLVFVDGKSVGVTRQIIGKSQGGRTSGLDYGVFTNDIFLKAENKLVGVLIPVFDENANNYFHDLLTLNRSNSPSSQEMNILSNNNNNNNIIQEINNNYIYNTLILNKQIFMNIFAYLYVDDTGITSHSIFNLNSNLNYIGNQLLEIGARFKYKKTHYKILNSFYLENEEYQQYKNKEEVVEIYNKKVNRIKENEPISYLGADIFYNESTKMVNFNIHFRKVIGISYRNIIDIPVSITKMESLNDKRSILVGCIGIYGLQFAKLNQENIVKYNKLISYGIRKLFNIYMTSRNSIKRIMFGIESIISINHKQLLHNFMKLMSDDIIKIMVGTQSHLIESKKIKIKKIKRRLVENKQIWQFKMDDVDNFYVNDIFDIINIYKLNTKELINGEYQKKITDFHFNVDMTKVINGDNLLKYVFNLNINVNNKYFLKYTTKYLKLIYEFINIMRLNKNYVDQLLRLIAGNTKIHWMKMTKDKKCVLCEVEFENEWIGHLINRKCQSFEIKEYVEWKTEFKAFEEYKKNVFLRLLNLYNVIDVFNHMQLTL